MGGEFGTIRHAGLARHLDTRAGQVVPLPRPEWTVSVCHASRPLCCCIPASNRPSPVSLKLEGPLPSPGSRGERCRRVPSGLTPSTLASLALSCRARARPRPTSHAAAPPPRVQEDEIPAVFPSNDNVPASHPKLDVTTVSGGCFQRVAAILTARCPAKPPTDTETTGWGSSGWWASSR